MDILLAFVLKSLLFSSSSESQKKSLVKNAQWSRNAKDSMGLFNFFQKNGGKIFRGATYAVQLMCFAHCFNQYVIEATFVGTHHFDLFIELSRS